MTGKTIHYFSNQPIEHKLVAYRFLIYHMRALPYEEMGTTKIAYYTSSLH